MTTILGLALVLLGLAIGFVIAWGFGVGASTGLTVGVLLLVAGVLIGFISEWLIDEAYRRNRELRQQLNEQSHRPVFSQARGDNGGQENELASETLADFLRQRDEELSQLRDRLNSMNDRFGRLQDEFETYQQTHPDDLTVIKGIGPVYQWKLRDIGISSYKHLAQADPDQLERMLDIKNWQRANVASWIDQARDWAQRNSNV